MRSHLNKNKLKVTIHTFALHGSFSSYTFRPIPTTVPGSNVSLLRQPT